MDLLKRSIWKSVPNLSGSTLFANAPFYGTLGLNGLKRLDGGSGIDCSLHGLVGTRCGAILGRLFTNAKIP